MSLDKVELSHYDTKETHFECIGLITGGFDPIHDGHVALIKGAKPAMRKFISEYFPNAYIDKIYLVGGLNSDEWLTRKKGKPFMGFEIRKKILESIKGIDYVMGFVDSDDTAMDAIEKLQLFADFRNSLRDNMLIKKTTLFFFINGGDRTKETCPEYKILGSKGRENRTCFLFGVGGEKTNSSSELLKEYVNE